MATYVLGTVGGQIAGPENAWLGKMIGATIGGAIDVVAANALNPGVNTTNTGPRLTEMHLTTSVEGTSIQKGVGRMRIGGQVIWAAQFKENQVTQSQSAGGKGGGGSTTTNISYTYSLSFAVAFCEGNDLTHLGRVWIDGNEVDLSKYNVQFYPGSETQQPAPLIEAIEGVENTPAYRGIAYLLFEDLPLASFGNRLPQVTAEIVVPLATDDEDDLSNLGRSWQLIPGTGEFIYGTRKYVRLLSEVVSDSSSVSENVHNNFNIPDVEASLDILTKVQPNLDAISIVVTWFGTDLRAGQCRIVPKTERRDRYVKPAEWTVAGYTRFSADLVSLDAEGRSNFGGTPSDISVRELVAYIKNEMGKRVIFYPFVIMDIPGGNSLENPYSDNAAEVGQAAFPWRGRITCSPAAGFVGTVDKTSAAATQVNTWFNRSEGYRTMVLHYANLLDDLLGADDGFVIGSELVGLTSVRSSSGAGTYPAVNQLVTLASDVSAILSSSVKIGYAADWSEYHSHRPSDGTGDVIFNMDPLWASSDIDFIGIDNYFPMSDWREGINHLDYDIVNGPTTIYDKNYLISNIEGGEYYDFYYASPSDRDTQTRTPIIDTAYSKDWVFRQKDIRNWWGNNHVNRPGGIEVGSNTSYTPSNKPIWFTEFGAPAVDKATNQPNVFYDPKSSESVFPYYSLGTRDDMLQRLYLEVFLAYWRDNGGSMVDIDNCFIWTWDARPFPSFPAKTDVWSDGPQWALGHWLSGRIDGVMLPRFIKHLCKEAGLTDSQIDIEGMYGSEALIRGFVISGQMSARSVLESLAQAYEFKSFESNGTLKFIFDINQKTIELPVEDLVLADDASAPVHLVRTQEIELPRLVNVSYVDEINNYQAASVDSHKGTGTSKNQVSASFPLVWSDQRAKTLATSMLFKAWAAREKGSFALPPSYAKVEVGDLAYIPVGSRAMTGQITNIDDTNFRQTEFVGFDISVLVSPGYETDIRLPNISTPNDTVVVLVFMNLPLVSVGESYPYSLRLAAAASNTSWPGGINLLQSDAAGGFVATQTIENRTSIGSLGGTLFTGPTNVWDRTGEIYVNMLNGGLSSLTETQLLAGNLNAMAIENTTTNEWEVIQFAAADLQSSGSYKLTGLIRGQLGTEHVMRNPYPEGTRVVFLDFLTVVPLAVSKLVATDNTLYRWGPSTIASDDDRYVEGNRLGTQAGYRPYSPCDLRVAKNSANDDLVLTWKRRTRINGDDWEQLEVPLNEEIEQYLLEIYDDTGATLKRSEVLSSSTFTYTAAMQAADQGSVQTDVFVKVSQYGTDYGNYGPALSGMFYMGSAF